MRKLIITASIILSALMILETMNAGHALMMFLLAGIIPGTSIALSAGEMLSIFAFLAGFVMARVTQTAISRVLTQRTAALT